MATLIPQSSNVEAAYEDMFKEITRKLYGEETGNGLHTLGTPVAQVATTGPTAPEGERSFTNLQIDRTSAPTIEYEHNAGNVVAAATVVAAAAAASANVVIQQQPEGSVVVATTGGGGGGGNFKTEDHHLNTAFGLAALMQNGFTTATTAAATGGGDQQQQQQQQQPQIVQWTTTGGKLQSYTTTQQQQQPLQQQQQQQQVSVTKSKSKNRHDHTASVSNANEVIYTSPSTSGNTVVQQTNQQQVPSNTANTSNSSGGGSSGGGRKKSNNSNNQQNSNQNNNNNSNNSNSGVQIQKRYACTHCPYSTDRRDLYTRHENIHKDEKPFQCYACLKQFNRADHVKKHFLRMHREMQYDINKTRRHVPSSSSSHHSGGRGNVTINTTVKQTLDLSSNINEQKPNIAIIGFQAANVQIDNAFLESQRQPTSSSMSIAETIEAVATAADEPLPQLKQEKNDDGSIVGGNNIGTIKPKREKRFTCCYCPWSGADKWGLKRHLNTHTKPFVCLLCDYKAARSERLATHVLKVHNKRACNKCSFLADTQEEYQAHISEVHLLKMDAISRNTASVAQDFHKAGGVHELKIPANHQLLFNNKLPSQWTTREAAALLHSLSNATQNINNFAYYQQEEQNQSSERSKFNSNGFYNQVQQNVIHLRTRQHSTGEDDENTPSSASSTTSSDGVSPMRPQRGAHQRHNEDRKPKEIVAANEQRKAMTAFLSKNFDLQETNSIGSSSSANNNNTSKRKYQKYISHDENYEQRLEDQENQVQLIRSPPAYNNNYKSNSRIKQSQQQQQHQHQAQQQQQQRNASNFNRVEQPHRLELFKDRHRDKENQAATFLTQMEYQNLNKIGTQFQNYVKDIINKYYAETPLMFPAMPTATTTPQQAIQQNQVPPTKRRRLLSETEEYIEYLKNKEDITLTITPKNVTTTVKSLAPQSQPLTISPVTTITRAINESHFKQDASPKHPQDFSLKKQDSSEKSFSPFRSVIQQQQLLEQHLTTVTTATTATTITGNNNFNKSQRKSFSQLTTLLPLLADAASQQQYLTAPLDFSKKSTTIATTNEQPLSESYNADNIVRTISPNIFNNSNSNNSIDKRSSRKQAQPKKIRMPPEMVLTMLRDKYLNRLMDHKLSCSICCKRRQMLVFNYHTKGSLTLHRYWKHRIERQVCKYCKSVFKQYYSLRLHVQQVHGKRMQKKIFKKFRKPKNAFENVSNEYQ